MSDLYLPSSTLHGMPHCLSHDFTWSAKSTWIVYEWNRPSVTFWLVFHNLVTNVSINVLHLSRDSVQVHALDHGGKLRYETCILLNILANQ